MKYWSKSPLVRGLRKGLNQKRSLKQEVRVSLTVRHMLYFRAEVGLLKCRLTGMCCVSLVENWVSLLELNPESAWPVGRHPMAHLSAPEISNWELPAGVVTCRTVKEALKVNFCSNPWYSFLLDTLVRREMCYKPGMRLSIQPRVVSSIYQSCGLIHKELVCDTAFISHMWLFRILW